MTIAIVFLGVAMAFAVGVSILFPTRFEFPGMPEVPLPPWATPLKIARSLGVRAGVDGIWLMRDEEQAEKNERCRQDWATRFLVLGPRA